MFEVKWKKGLKDDFHFISNVQHIVNVVFTGTPDSTDQNLFYTYKYCMYKAWSNSVTRPAKLKLFSIP